MKDLLFYFNTVAPVVNHLIPLLITLVICLAILFVKKGLPYVRYINLVAQAKCVDGEIRLAKYLAKEAGGKHVDTKDAYLGFVPAARNLHKLHIDKREFFGLLD